MKTICKHPVVGAANVECNCMDNPHMCALFSASRSGVWCDYSQIIGSVCVHGHLDRQCELCERDARIAELEARIAELEMN